MTFGSCYSCGIRGERVRRGGDEIAIKAENIPGPGHRVNQQARQDRADRVELELKRGDDAEVSAATAQAPEEIFVFAGAGREEAPVGSDDVSGEEIVTG